jgi:hypothetical protein
MIVSLLYIFLFAISGIFLSEVVFQKHRFSNRLWLGLTIGLLLLTWLPVLFAFLTGFTLTAQILAACVAFVSSVICGFVLYRRNGLAICSMDRSRIKWPVLFLIIPIILLGCYLFYTHVLYRRSDGSLWVGQVTYGDLAMHLGFVSSIAEQTTFPPQYSIFPGHALNYPFLCETSASTLYQLGASLRQAYLITSIYAFVLVTVGVFKFFEQWLKKTGRAVFATVLFFFGGGFGFAYFFDLSKTGGALNSLLSAGEQTVASLWLDGFYITPTNIPDLGLRWVNTIVDMLVPQRATLFGWAFLFPCLYLLHGFTFEKKRENVIPLAVFAGLLPLIHTHSFLALGLISATYCIQDLIAVRFEKKRLICWVLYAGIACLLAFPQLFAFTFRQASEGSLVRIHLNWANNADSYLWFYIKNFGLIFLLMPFAFFLLSKKDRKVYMGVIPLWLISEFVIFQINEYDNNKLLFIWFAYTCAIVTKLLFVLMDRADRLIRRRSSKDDRIHTLGVLAALPALIFSVYFFLKLLTEEHNRLMMRQGTALTLFVLACMYLSISIAGIVSSRSNRRRLLIWIGHTAIALWMIVSVFIIWYRQYERESLRFTAFYAILTVILCVIGLILLSADRLFLRETDKSSRFVGLIAAKQLCIYMIVFVMTVSSAMTILRECRSEYRVYSSEEVDLIESIKSNTEPDETILASSYLWNLVTPITGRNIVTGTGTFLFYHGINGFIEREEDVRSMFRSPGDHADLFKQYGVRYVLISNPELGYTIDYAYFEQNGTIVASNGAGTLYLLSDPS